MPKDPAFLFYPNDWMGGTMSFTRHIKGCYIDLLIAQFNIGPLSLETIKTVLGTDQAVWTVLSKKFKQDSTGNFFNERLATEVEKRKSYSESRRKNRSGKEDMINHMSNHMSGHMENRNRNKNEDQGKEGAGEREKWAKKPTDTEVPLEEMEGNATIEFIHRLKKILLSGEQVNDLWMAFKIQNFTGEKFYHTRSDCIQHFRNWLKSQDYGTDKKSNSASGKKPGTSESRMQVARTWGGKQLPGGPTG